MPQISHENANAKRCLFTLNLNSVGWWERRKMLKEISTEEQRQIHTKLTQQKIRHETPTRKAKIQTACREKADVGFNRRYRRQRA